MPILAFTDPTNADPHSPGVSIVNITTFNYSTHVHQQSQTSLPQALVRVRVSESVSEGQLLLWARARDPDVGENARVIYELDPDAPAAVRTKFDVGASLLHTHRRQVTQVFRARAPPPPQFLD